MKMVITVTPSEARFAPIMMRGSISETFQLASDYGFDAIEVHLRNPKDVDWDEMLALSEKYSLPITTLGTGMAVGMDGLVFTDDDADVRKHAIERVTSHIELASLAKCCVTIGILNGNIGIEPQQAQQKKGYHFDCLKQCAEAAEAAGVILLLEPLNRYECDWLNTTEQTLDLINKLDSANVKYLADTFHMNIEEADIAQSIRKAEKKFGYIHLVDSNRQVPGHGHVQFVDILRALRDIGYDSYISFECLPWPDVKTACADAISYVREMTF